MRRQTVVTHRRLLALVGALLLVTVEGCSDTAEGDRGRQGKGLVAPRPSVTNGALNCGDFKIVNGSEPGGVTDAGWACFSDAMREHQLAILHLTQTTSEGDPVYVTFTSRLDGRADVVTDSSHDRFGGSGARITTQTCRELDPRPAAKRVLFFKVCTPSA